MNCPRCGTPHEKGDRYCASCGAVLTKADKPERSLRERALELIGTTRRQRIVSGITAGMIVAAIVALVVTFVTTEDVEEGEISQDAYTVAADEICVQSKQQVLAALQERAGSGPLARNLVRIVAEWRAAANSLEVPEDRALLAAELDTALREVEVEAGAMATAARAGEGPELQAGIDATQKATEHVESSIDALGLELCGDIAFVQTPAPE